MALPVGHRNNFQTLLRAAENDDVCLVQAVDLRTQERCAIICAVQHTDDGQVELVPFARMFDGNPYDEVRPDFPDDDEDA
jgi:hypothetical protein